MLMIDKLCYLSKLRYENPTCKFLYAMFSLIVTIASKSIVIALFLMTVNFLFTVILAEISFKRYVKLMFIPFSFLVLSTLAIAVNISDKPLDLFAIPLYGYYISSSYKGVYSAITLVITALSSVSSLYFLSLNTPMTDIIFVLKKLKFPKIIIELMILIYRYIFILLDIAEKIKISQESRLSNRDYKTSIKSFSLLLSALFIRSIKKSRILFDAMEARCYDGELNFISEDYTDSSKLKAYYIIVSLISFILFIDFKFVGYIKWMI